MVILLAFEFSVRVISLPIHYTTEAPSALDCVFVVSRASIKLVVIGNAAAEIMFIKNFKKIIFYKYIILIYFRITNTFKFNHYYLFFLNIILTCRTFFLVTSTVRWLILKLK
jgi:hypothetical protein